MSKHATTVDRLTNRKWCEGVSVCAHTSFVRKPSHTPRHSTQSIGCVFLWLGSKETCSFDTKSCDSASQQHHTMSDCYQCEQRQVSAVMGVQLVMQLWPCNYLAYNSFCSTPLQAIGIEIPN